MSGPMVNGHYHSPKMDWKFYECQVSVPVFNGHYFRSSHCFEMLSVVISIMANRSCHVVVVVVDPTPPTCCQQSPAPESCGSQQSLPPGGKERLHFVGIRPEVQARKGGW